MNCFALEPNAYFISGQSIPQSLIRFDTPSCKPDRIAVGYGDDRSGELCAFLCD